MAAIKRRAVFLDRDGTLVHTYHYPSRPEHLRLYEDIGPALHKLQGLGYALVMITNQSGLAHGYFTEVDLQTMHAYLRTELARWDVRLDGIYYCPHHLEGVVPEFAVHCDCRKPRPGMLYQAATELELDLPHSWFVGDILDDVEASNRAGCQSILVDLETEKMPEVILRLPNFVARNTVHALNIIQTLTSPTTQADDEVDFVYVPPSWRVEDTEMMNNAYCAGEVNV
jgi:D-glycero-D-manno-heptose 1,7-bisphosphate phosphatase